MKRSELFFSVLLIPVDAAALLAAFVSAYNLRNEYGLFAPGSGIISSVSEVSYGQGEIVLSLQQYLHYLSFIVPGMLVIFGLLGLYSLRANASLVRRFFQVLVGVSAGECFILFLFLLKKDFFLPRSTVLYSWVLAVAFVLLARTAVRLVQRSLNRYGIGVIRTGVIGAGVAAAKVLAAVRDTASYRLDFQAESLPVDKVLEKLAGVELDELIVVNERYGNDELIALRNWCLEHAVSFSFVPSLLTELQSSFGVDQVAGLPAIEVMPTPLEGWGRVVKRIFDLVVAGLLIILFSPFYLGIALAMKLASPGPLIYKHRRIGKNGAPVHVWKFRTLKWEYCTGVGGEGDRLFKELLAKRPDLAAEWKATHKLKDDPRVSGPGRFLRKTSLDELPQFFNVLGGSLSLVGPRPIVQEEVEKYGEGARILFTVKPGVTGLWQVSGRNDTSYEERILLDTRYIEHWKVWSDVAILARTALVLAGKGAY